MASWTELQDRVRREFQLDLDEDDEFALTIERRDPSGTRAQRVMVRHYTAWDQDMVELRSAFGELEHADPGKLLADSLQLPVGAIACHGRFLVLVHKACLTHMTVEGVVFLLTRVSMLADVLEERRGGDRF